jgi:alkylation response protein AidB-like acyl-CoA dehydrogenase
VLIYCLTEPGAGSDANSGKTKAVLSEDGKHTRLQVKKFQMQVSVAYLSFLRIGDDKNIGFIVENDPNVELMKKRTQQN